MIRHYATSFEAASEATRLAGRYRTTYVVRRCSYKPGFLVVRASNRSLTATQHRVVCYVDRHGTITMGAGNATRNEREYLRQFSKFASQIVDVEVEL